MSGIDLNSPIDDAAGSDALRAGALRDIPWGGLALGGMALIAASLVAFVKVTDDTVVTPRAATDTLVARRISVPDLTPPRDNDATSSIARTIRASALPSHAGAMPVDAGDGVQVVQRSLGAATRDIRIGLAPAPDIRLTAPGPYGPLPRIGRDGARPSDVYARPQSAPAKGAPRIAIVVTGLGLNAPLSAEAVESLPPAVTLAYLAYGDAIEDQAEQARIAGHELLLQAPMEGAGDERASAPRTLAVNAPRHRTLDALHWHMSRFPGYIGLTQAQGARFMASPQALSPVLQDVADRGLLFLDASTSSGALTLALAGAAGTQAERADVVLDASPTPEAIDAALRRLEGIARERGAAIGVAGVDGGGVDRIARFTQGLDARGFVLVPASALMQAPARTSAR
ncbi:MAG: hypothetical protein JWN07_155 [Hyphomicrobiales bacterium]|nr:hypothetical protein [Hyphomicrobiales bacterium]